MRSSGIYQIINKKNYHMYIGSAVYFKKRWHEHKKSLNKGTHHSIPLQRAWNKYGEDSFEFFEIELVDKKSLILREQFYLDLWKPEYNVCKVAGSQLGLKRSNETKEKISIAQTGERHFKYGKHLSEDHKQKISRSNKKQIPWNKGIKNAELVKWYN